jgi:hypothetical protein
MHFVGFNPFNFENTWSNLQNNNIILIKWFLPPPTISGLILDTHIVLRALSPTSI